MRLLDLFCGAGGSAVGYHRAGFTDVVGVDTRPMPRYPFAFARGDALEYLTAHGREFDAIHASPPCQRYSSGTRVRPGSAARHPDLVAPTRELLDDTGRPYVIENVEGSPLGAAAGRYAVRLCGLMFGLRVFRHRLFESNMMLLSNPHPPHGNRRIGAGGFVCVAGHGGRLAGWAGSGTRRTVPRDHRDKASWERAMGVDWMTRDELAQAIPPAYTLFVGRQLLDHCRHLRETDPCA